MYSFKKQLVIFTGLAYLLFFYTSCTKEIIENREISSEQSNNIVSPFSNHHYVGNLDYVLGDVKQAQIRDLFNNTTQINNVLDGFEEMGVNGVRIAIFADGVNPNESMYNQLYTRAKARGFKIFANPAEHGGGKRIANGILHAEDGGLGPSVLGKTSAKNALVARIKAFAAQYKCDWISPFNEDAKPGALWYANQMTNIYAELYKNVNGAKLIGPCAWGIPASLECIQQSNILDYVSIATTHNLGFNHSDWEAFTAEAGDLPVWDSEVNNFKKFEDRDTRIDAAIAAGVNGLVLYDTWNTINLNTGELKNTGQEIKDKITQYYYIVNKKSGKRIKPFNNNNENSLMVQVPNYWNGDFTQWELIPTDAGYFQFRNKGSKMYFRPETNNDLSDIISKESFSGGGAHTQWRAINASDNYIFLENRGSGKRIRSRNDDDITINNDPEIIKINLSPTAWTGDRSQWKIVPAN